MPMQWPLNDEPGECTFEVWIELRGNAAHVRSRLNNARSDKTFHAARNQELPAVYTNGAYWRLMTYTGDKPFTGDKLVRGLANVCLGFLEIPRNIHNTTQEESLLAGWTVGVGKGLGYTVMRMGVGVYEVITFPFPLPKDYVPVVTPEYVWQAPGPRMK